MSIFPRDLVKNFYHRIVLLQDLTSGFYVILCYVVSSTECKRALEYRTKRDRCDMIVIINARANRCQFAQQILLEIKISRFYNNIVQ